MPPYAIEINELRKVYPGVVAVDGVSMSIPAGECFGLLGPNGAGKTTLIRILTTLIKPTSGSAAVGGYDVVRESARVREIIGVIPQAMTSDLDLTGFEILDIHARFFGMKKGTRRAYRRAAASRRFAGQGRGLVATYSGGMRRRLEIARGLVHKPSILILDEPTIGLDPQSRHVVWDLLEKFMATDLLTILLTTHYMEEAESLCDKVAIIDYGKIVALDTVDGLKKQIPEKDVVELTVSGYDLQAAASSVRTINNVTSCALTGDTLIVSADNGAEIIPVLVDALKRLGALVRRVTLKEQTLEDVFIHFTGRPIREEEAKKVSFLLGAGVPTKLSR